MESAVALRVTAVCVMGIAVACAPRYHPDPAYRVDVDQVFAAHAGGNREIPAPATLEPKPWKVGAWALYKRGGTSPDTGFVGYEKISVVAEDACGIWIVDESHGYYDRHRWTFCLRRPPTATDARSEPLDLVQVAIWESNGGPPDIIDFRFGQFTKDTREVLRPVIQQLLPPDWPKDASLAREDVEVPAGRFQQAILATHKLHGSKPVEITEWTHPDVPFDATVRRRVSNGHDYLLLAYGDSGATGVVPRLASVPATALEPKPSPSNFFSIGIGYGWFSGHSSEQSSQADSFSLITGVRLTPKVDVIGEVGGLLGAGYSPDPMQSQDTFIALVGVRWAPFRLPYLQPGLPHGSSALYLQADIGYTDLLRDSMTSTDSVGRGLALGAGVGWLGLQAHDWAFGLELEDHLAIFNRGEGVRNSVGLLVRWQLYMPLAR